MIRGSSKLKKHDLEDRFFRLQWKRRRNGEPREITKSVTLKVHSVCPVAKTLPTFSLHLCLPAATRRRIGSSFPPRPRTHVHLLCVPCIRNRCSLVSVARFFLYCSECCCCWLPFEFILEKTMSGIREKRLVETLTRNMCTDLHALGSSDDTGSFRRDRIVGRTSKGSVFSFLRYDE